MFLDLVDFLHEDEYELMLPAEDENQICPMCGAEFGFDDSLEWVTEEIVICPGCGRELRIV